MLAALALLGLFVGSVFMVHEHSLQKSREQGDTHEVETMPDTAGVKPVRLALHDFEWGNASDTATHLAMQGHGGKQSLKMSSRVPFSTGLWMQFKDLKQPGSSWIRVTGYVWFSCPPADAKCSLVATCNHKGINYKYMFVALDKESLKPNQWNRVSIDYRIPAAVDRDDVLQAYFWYRGNGELLVDDIDVECFSMDGKINH